MASKYVDNTSYGVSTNTSFNTVYLLLSEGISCDLKNEIITWFEEIFSQTNLG